MDALFFIGELLVNPIAAYAASSQIASLLVSILPKQDKEEKKVGFNAKRTQFLKKFGENAEDPRRNELISNIARETNDIKKIDKKSFLSSIYERFKATRYNRLLHKS